MCGIFGITVTRHSPLDGAAIGRLYRSLFLLSESRGKEASGFALLNGENIAVYKTPHPASRLVRDEAFKNALRDTLQKAGQRPLTLLGHSRLVTNGAQQFNRNNQPFVKSGIVGIHNGIIVNEKALWETYRDEIRLSQLDSELVPTLLRRFYTSSGSMVAALHRMFAEIYGTASLALLFDDLENLLLTTNNGSLYVVRSTDGQAMLFASEHAILDALLSRGGWGHVFSTQQIAQLKPGRACLIRLDTAESEEIEYADSHSKEKEFGTRSDRSASLPVLDISGEETAAPSLTGATVAVHVPSGVEEHFSRCEQIIRNLRRCSKCLLPETFPFIIYNEAGVCNYCANYKRWEVQPQENLEAYVAPFRRNDGRPDCIVTFSGGRDSSYGLHYVREVLKLTPLAYSYDWGMITDLARRNQARLCGKLGIEHILVSADIRKKRANIRKNVLAWLKRPSLGTIPLFMAGDKQYFYHANRLREQNNISLVVLCENMLETTDFKAGFCGIEPTFDKAHTYSLSLAKKIRMATFYGKEFLFNPSFINTSIIDTIGAFISYYFIPHDYLNIYNFVRWDEATIDRTLKECYDWETAEDTKSTWRIGDGTAAFYNYIYYVVAGFSENDTFRSNQIREGMLTREKALHLSMAENLPRYESIQWYCNTIGIDFGAALKRINQIPSRFSEHLKRQ